MATRLARALTEPMYLLSVEKEFDQNFWLFKIKSKQIYAQKIGPEGHICTCQDYELHHALCKHLLFLMVKLIFAEGASSAEEPVSDPEDMGWSPEAYSFYDSIWTSLFIDILFPKKRNEKQCAICFDDIEGADDTICCLFSCQNVFHTRCISKWLAVQNTCPFCRYKYITSSAEH